MKYYLSILILIFTFCKGYSQISTESAKVGNDSIVAEVTGVFDYQIYRSTTIRHLTDVKDSLGKLVLARTDNDGTLCYVFNSKTCLYTIVLKKEKAGISIEMNFPVYYTKKEEVESLLIQLMLTLMDELKLEYSD